MFHDDIEDESDYYNDRYIHYIEKNCDFDEYDENKFKRQQYNKILHKQKEWKGNVCRYGHFKEKNSSCGKCEKTKIKQKKLKIQGKKLKEFIDLVIELSKIAIARNIPKDIVGEISTFFLAPQKSEKARRKKGQAIFDEIYNLLIIKKHVVVKNKSLYLSLCSIL
jgi:hypothetical protein